MATEADFTDSLHPVVADYRKRLAEQGFVDSQDDYEVVKFLGQQNPTLLEQYPDFGQLYGEIREANAPSLTGETSRAFKRATIGLGSTAVGGAALLTGSDYLKRKAAAISLQASDPELAPTIPTLEDIRSPRDAFRYGASKVGEAAPSLGEAVGVGLAGAAIGSSFGPGGTLAGGVLGRAVVKRAIQSLVSKGLTEEAIVAGLKAGVPKIMEAVATNAASIAKVSGGAALAGINSYLLNSGEVYSENDDRGTAAALGLVAALPDTILPALVIRRIFPGVTLSAGRQAAKELVGKNAIKALEAAGLVGLEATTEAFQEGVNIVARNLKEGVDPLTLREGDVIRMREAGITGAVGGALAAPAVVLGRGPEDVVVPPPPAPPTPPAGITPSAPIIPPVAPPVVSPVSRVRAMTDGQKRDRLAELSANAARTADEEAEYQLLLAVAPRVTPPTVVPPTAPPTGEIPNAPAIQIPVPEVPNQPIPPGSPPQVAARVPGDIQASAGAGEVAEVVPEVVAAPDPNLERAIASKYPIWVSAVERAGMQIPEGYVREGDRYVFKQAPVQPPTAVPTAAVAPVDIGARNPDISTGEGGAGTPFEQKMNADWAKAMAAEVARPPFKLPKELAGAKSNYGYGKNNFPIKFDSDLDKATYILAQDKPSRSDAKYLATVLEQTGMTEAEARAMGQEVKGNIKEMAKGVKAGETLRVRATIVPQPTSAPRGFVKKFGSREDGVVDIIDAIQEMGGVPRPGKKSTGGEANGFKEAFSGPAAALVAKGKISEGRDSGWDTYMQALVDQFPEFSKFEKATAGEVGDEVNRVLAERAKLKRTMAADRLTIKFEERALGGKGKNVGKPVDKDTLTESTKFKSGGVQFEVSSIREDGSVVVKDGPEFGTQVIPAGAPALYPDKNSLKRAKVSTDFLSEEEVAPLAPLPENAIPDAEIPFNLVADEVKAPESALKISEDQAAIKAEQAKQGDMAFRTVPSAAPTAEQLARPTYEELRGQKVQLEAITSEGETVLEEQDAADAWAETQKRRHVFQMLLKCLQGT